MDERQRQVKVGEGFQESNLNQDFIDFLKKWGDWALYGVLAVVLVYFGAIQWNKYQARERDAAFREYADVRGIRGTDAVLGGSPDSLLIVADESKGRGSVPELARLSAAEIYLACARRGIAPGGDVRNPAEADILSPEAANAMFQQAAGIFQQVANDLGNNPKKPLLRIRAHFGIAATAQSLGDIDAARAALTTAKSVADENVFPILAARAERDLQSLDLEGAQYTLYTVEELPPSMRPPEQPNFGAPSGTGSRQPIEVTPVPPGQESIVTPEGDVLLPVQPQDDQPSGEGDTSAEGTDEPEPSDDGG